MQKLDKLAVLENEMVMEKVMERVKLAKMSWNSVTSHGILPILPFLPTLRNLASVHEVCIFQPFLKDLNRKMVIENQETANGKVVGKKLAKSVGTV